jgi:putative ATP-dependent endonuclease of OLD family
MPRFVVSTLPWNDSVARLAEHQGDMLFKDPTTRRLAAKSWFDPTIADHLAGCFRGTSDETTAMQSINEFRHSCRGLVTLHEELELSFFGRRIRGEIFFARRWLLVEGQCEYVLLHAIGRALGYPLDRHGVAVIDFQNNGNAVIYPSLATSFAIPWSMVVDGDQKDDDFRDRLMKRGFAEAEIREHLQTLTPPNNLETQLIADGHEGRLRELLAEATSQSALTCPTADFLARLGRAKVDCISRLALQVERDPELARRMPRAFVDLLLGWKGETA